MIIVNEMRPARHHFLVLIYIKLHNNAIKNKLANYLNPFIHINKGPSNKKRSLCHD